MDNNIINLNEIPWRRGGPYPEFRNCFDIVFDLLVQIQPSQQYLNAILNVIEGLPAITSIEILQPILDLFPMIGNENEINNNNNNNNNNIDIESDNESNNSSNNNN